jgi:hypothetical protein
MRFYYLITSLLVVMILTSAKPNADLLNAKGRITMLRVHDVGTAYGPPNDRIDVEVVIWLDSKPGSAFGFQMRTDAQQVTRKGMLDLLRDAFKNNWPVSIDYTITLPKKNGIIIRAWVEKNPNTQPVITPQ